MLNPREVPTSLNDDRKLRHQHIQKKPLDNYIGGVQSLIL